MQTEIPTKNEISISTNPVIELLSVVQFLADDKFNTTKSNNNYVNNVQHFFGVYANHPAVIWYKNNSKNVFTSFNAAQVYFIQFDLQNEKLVFSKPQSQDIYHQYGFSKPADFYTEKDFVSMPSKLDKFKNLLENFCQDTNFENFYKAQSKSYQLMINQCKPIIDAETLQHYFGCNSLNYQIILAPLFTDMTYLPYENKFNYICISGAMQTQNEAKVIFDNNEIQAAILFDVNNTICSQIIDSIYYPNSLTTETDLNRMLLYKIRTANYLNLCVSQFKINADLKPVDVATARINYLHIVQQYIPNRKIYPTFKNFIENNYLKILETAKEVE